MRYLRFCTLLVASGSTLIAGCGPAAPVAAPDNPIHDDRYSIAAGMKLDVAAPGVLENDDITSDDAVAELVSKPKWGKLTFNADGSFSYTPRYKFAGNDYFSYRVTTDGNASEPVTVRIGFPNVIVMIVDDLGMGYIGAYNNKAPVPTPNLDALAASGMRFTRAHSPAAVCSPSRYSILTGNHPYRGNQATGVWGSYHPETMIVPGQQTLGHIFSSAGYQTGFVGKMHNGAAFRERDSDGYTRNPDEIDFAQPYDRGPTQFGFNYSFTLPGGLSAPPYAYFENDRLVRYNATSGDYEHFATDADARQHLRTDIEAWSAAPKGGGIGGGGLVIDNYDSRKTGAILTRKALGFIDAAVAANDSPAHPEPFFLYFAPPQMHTPWTPPEFFDPAHDRDDEPSTSGAEVLRGDEGLNHQALISEIDLMVGALVDRLDELGQLDNTLIVFSSDNGPTVHDGEIGIAAQGREGGLVLRGYKGEMHEAGHRVPLLARWGDGTSASPIAPGAVSGELLGLHDLSATFYSLVGLPRPAGQANDSKSLLPELTGDRPLNTPLREQLIVQGSPASAADNGYRIDRALYQRGPAGDLWKLTAVSSLNDPLADIEWRDLYNLSTDPAEQNDRRNDAAVSAWQDEMRATYLDLVARERTVESFR